MVLNGRCTSLSYFLGGKVLPEDKMPEAEVTLRLAISLIENEHVIDDIRVTIDGAQVKTKTLFISLL